MNVATESETAEMRTGFRLSAADRRALAVMLAIKLLLFIFAAQAYQIWTGEPLKGWLGWLEVWQRWDGPSYLRIAQFGYSNAPDQQYLLVLYPLFPWLIRAVALVVRNYAVSAMIVSMLASLAAGLLLLRLVELDYGTQIAERAVWFLFIFPTSYFLHAPYTEGLLLALALGSLLAARKGKWAAAGLLGALVCLTRGPGLVIIPTLCVQAWQQYRETRRWQWSWLWIGVAPLGTLVYLLVNARVMGSPLAFLPVARDKFFVTLAWPWTGIDRAVGALEQSPAVAQMVGQQVLIFMILSVVCAVEAWYRLRPVWTAWMLLNVALCVSLSFPISYPRFTLVMFPIYVLFAKLAEDRFWNAALVFWSLINLGLFTSVFIRGAWAF